MRETFFQVQAPGVTFEDFKSEILIIDLKTGHYHSLRGSSVYLWRLLNSGHSVESSVVAMAGFYQKAVPVVESEIRSFVLELEQLGLISSVPDLKTIDFTVEGLTDVYSKPTIDSYGDLQDLLLLDPIHEIAPEAGWPQIREGT